MCDLQSAGKAVSAREHEVNTELASISLALDELRRRVTRLYRDEPSVPVNPMKIDPAKDQVDSVLEKVRSLPDGSIVRSKDLSRRRMKCPNSEHGWHGIHQDGYKLPNCGEGVIADELRAGGTIVEAKDLLFFALLYATAKPAPTPTEFVGNEFHNKPVQPAP